MSKAWSVDGEHQPKERMSSSDKVTNARSSKVKHLFIFNAEQKRANPVLRLLPPRKAPEVSGCVPVIGPDDTYAAQ